MSTNGSDRASAYGITADEREQMLLDDLRVEVKHLREAIERNNELLAAVTTNKGERP